MSESDPTFVNYTNSQARDYAKGRGNYAASLHKIILDHHTKTGGKLNTLADVGCGPGNSTRPLAISFDHAIGLDPGVEMINTARSLAGTTAINEPIVYTVSGAESIANAIRTTLPSVDQNGGVDMITAAMAAHWFNMPKFWAEAASILKPRGTVALWTHSSLYCHPSTPNATEVQQALFRLERDVLAPFELPENRLSRDCYDNLLLPWNVNNESIANVFPESQFVRMEWDRDGILTDGENFFEGSDETTVNKLSASLQTASMVTRWREAHPDLVGTEEDCVTKAMAEVRQALGVKEDENPSFKVGNGTALLLFKRT